MKLYDESFDPDVFDMLSMRIAKDRGLITETQERRYIPKVEKLGKLQEKTDAEHEHAHKHKNKLVTGFSMTQK